MTDWAWRNGSALALGARSCWFESGRSDKEEGHMKIRLQFKLHEVRLNGPEQAVLDVVEAVARLYPGSKAYNTDYDEVVKDPVGHTQVCKRVEHENNNT